MTSPATGNGSGPRRMPGLAAVANQARLRWARLQASDWLAWLLVLPSVAFFLFFLAAPVAIVFFNSLKPNTLIAAPPNAVSLANYPYFFARSYYVAALARTLRFSVVVTLISLVVGYATALAIRRFGSALGSTLVLILAFPRLSGPVVTVLGWMIMFTGGGPIGQIVAAIRHLLGMAPLTRPLLGTEWAVDTGLLHFVIVFVVLNILNALLCIDPSLEEAAKTLGASPWQTFRRIIWPLSLPGLIAASLISVTLCMNAYVTPAFLGGGTQLVMSTLISQFMLASFNTRMASATAIILIVANILILVPFNKIMSRAVR